MRIFALLFSFVPLHAEAACRLALILALDVSGSVDEREYALQLGGIAMALEDRDVSNAILALPDATVNLMIFEWSSSSFQREVVRWTDLKTEPDIARVVEILRNWKRAAAPEATGLGAALRHAAELFEAGPSCWRKTLDVSGDGRNNDWPIPKEVKASGRLGSVTINGLVVGQTPMIGDERQMEIGELSAYYRSEILQGPGAFLETALGFESYGSAMLRKLLREVSAPPLGEIRRQERYRIVTPHAQARIEAVGATGRPSVGITSDYSLDSN